MPSIPLLHQMTVGEVMHEGVVTCSAAADIDQVAAVMADHGIHCVVAIDEGPAGEDDDRLWGVVSDLDLMRGLESDLDLDAGNLAELDVATVTPDDTLDLAARTMVRRGLAHLVVVDRGPSCRRDLHPRHRPRHAERQHHGEWYRPVAATYAARPSLTAATLTHGQAGPTPALASPAHGRALRRQPNPPRRSRTIADAGPAAA